MKDRRRASSADVRGTAKAGVLCHTELTQGEGAGGSRFSPRRVQFPGFRHLGVFRVSWETRPPDANTLTSHNEAAPRAQARVSHSTCGRHQLAAIDSAALSGRLGFKRLRNGGRADRLLAGCRLVEGLGASKRAGGAGGFLGEVHWFSSEPASLRLHSRRRGAGSSSARRNAECVSPVRRHGDPPSASSCSSGSLQLTPTPERMMPRVENLFHVFCRDSHLTLNARRMGTTI